MPTSKDWLTSAMDISMLDLISGKDETKRGSPIAVAKPGPQQRSEQAFPQMRPHSYET
jgi:hypothetical protein